jgi:hypothetical protein
VLSVLRSRARKRASTLRSFARSPVLFLLAGTGCVAEPNGDEVGTYRVTMSLVTNTCGPAAVNLQDGRSYTAQLRAEGADGLWRLPGQMPLSGTYDAGRFAFSYNSVVATSSPDAGTFCQLVQEEKLEGAVAATMDQGDAGTSDAASAKSASSPKDGGWSDDAFDPPDEGLVGRHVFNIKAAAGTDCKDALMPTGAFERLPCTVGYELKGSPAESF